MGRENGSVWRDVTGADRSVKEEDGEGGEDEGAARAQKVLTVGAVGGFEAQLVRNGSCRWGYCSAMARGNQRELARQKNMKKAQEHSKGKRKDETLSASQRKQRDSEIMQQKQKAADQKKTVPTEAK